MMADQPSYVAVDGNGDYLQDMQFQYEQPIQHNMNTEMSETFLQPQSQSQPQTQTSTRVPPFRLRHRRAGRFLNNHFTIINNK